MFKAIPTDKLIHFLGGACIAFAIGVFFPALGFIAAAAVGTAKEIYDNVSGKGTPDVWDALVTMLGGLVAFLIITVSQL